MSNPYLRTEIELSLHKFDNPLSDPIEDSTLDVLDLSKNKNRTAIFSSMPLTKYDIIMGNKFNIIPNIDHLFMTIDQQVDMKKKQNNGKAKSQGNEEMSYFNKNSKNQKKAKKKNLKIMEKVCLNSKILLYGKTLGKKGCPVSKRIEIARIQYKKLSFLM